MRIIIGQSMMKKDAQAVLSHQSSEGTTMENWPASLWPWQSAFRALGALHRPIDDEGDSCVDDDGVLWFRWTPSRDSSEHARQLALLQVLAHLVRFDRAAFEALLPDIGGEYGSHFVQYRARYEKDYQLGVYVRFDDDVSVDEVMNALGSFQGAQTSDPHVAALIEQLQLQWGPVGKRTGASVPVSFAFYHFSGRASTIVGQILDLVRFQQSSSDPLAYRVCVIQIDTTTRKWIDVSVALQMVELLRRGVRFPALWFGSPFTKSVTPLAILDVVQAYFLPRASDQLSAGLGRIRLTLDASVPVLMATMSALVQSSSVRWVEVDDRSGQRGGQPPNVERMWRWLVYALFSRDARHSVQRLEINADTLRGGAIEVFDEMLMHDDPLPGLLNIPEHPRSFCIDIPTGTSIELLVENMNEKSVCGTFVAPDDLLGLRAVYEDRASGFVYFLLPGWGESRVPCGAIRRHDQCVAQTSSSNLHSLSHSSRVGVPHLRFEYVSQRTASAVLRLLDAEGAHVRRLDIYEPDRTNFDLDNFMKQAIEKCPHLESLDLFAVELESLDWLVDVYVDGSCRVRRLKFRHTTVVDMSSVHTFFDTLGDMTHPMTLHLRELNFHVIERVVIDSSRGPVLNSCLKMLEKNLTLRECRAVTLSRLRAKQFEESFRRYDGQLLKIRKAPLDMRSKLAFLSVIEILQNSSKRHRDEGSTHRVRLSGIGSIDILSNVLGFAAECHVRECVMELPPSTW